MARMAPEQAWVVCLAETRMVVRRAVLCPLRGRVPASACQDCHLLVTSSIERARGGWCSAGRSLASGGAWDGLSEQLEADRLAARLECVAGPGEAAVLEEGVDRLVAGQHRGLQ